MGMFKKSIGKQMVSEDLQDPSVIKHVLKEYGVNAPENMLDKFCNDIHGWLMESKVQSDYGLKANIDSSGSEFRIIVTRQQTGAQFVWSSGFKYGKDFTCKVTSTKAREELINFINKIPRAVVESRDIDLICSTLKQLYINHNE